MVTFEQVAQFMQEFNNDCMGTEEAVPFTKENVEFYAEQISITFEEEGITEPQALEFAQRLCK